MTTTDPYAPMDHSLCPPDDHDFVYEPGDYDSPQAHDMYDRLACNHCHQPMFYCERDNQYHHAGADIEPCFLIPEDGQDVTDLIYCTRCGRPACGGADCRGLTDAEAAENKRLADQARRDSAVTGVAPPIGQPYLSGPTTRKCARCRRTLVDEDEQGWYYQAPATDPSAPGLTFMDRVHECDGQPHDVILPEPAPRER